MISAKSFFLLPLHLLPLIDTIFSSYNTSVSTETGAIILEAVCKLENEVRGFRYLLLCQS